MRQIATYCISFFVFILSVPFNSMALELTRSVYINEVMQSTFGGQYDMLNEYPDSWVELYNPGDNQISLKDYRIGKKNKYKKCYNLPDIMIPAKGHVVVYCDKADTVISYFDSGNLKHEIHADFRITTDVESSIYLFNTDGVLSDTIGLPKMPAPNIAYGRLNDGIDSLGWELKPTMGMANEGGLSNKILPKPVFLENSIVSSAKEGVELHRLLAYPPKRSPKSYVIRYTIDGTEPNETSEQMKYELYVSKNTVFKAAIFAENCITPPSETKVLLFNGHNIHLPVVSITASDEDLNSDKHGIISNNDSHEEDERFNWRRPAQFDYFFKGGGISKCSQKCEIRVGGAWTRENKLKTFIVYADKRFGTTDYFSAQFWQSNRAEISKSKSIALRSAGNDFSGSYMRDGAAQLVIGQNADIDWQGFQPAIYYINAKYQGIINIRERGNEDNIWAHYNNLEDITLIENNELKEGEYSQFQDFVGFYSDKTHTYQEFDSVMDIEEFMNLMIISSFMSNTDFPGNNNVLWRPIADGGKWRWILKDVDRSFNIWNQTPADYTYLNWVLRVDPFPSNETANNEYATLLFRNLMEIDEFKQKFIDRFTVYLGDFLRSKEINSVLTWCHDEMAPEWDYFAAAQSMKNKSSWEGEISNMKTWSNSRTLFMRSYLKSFFSLGQEIPTTVGIGSDAWNYNITINDVPLTKGEFDGSLYCGRNYKLKGDCKDSQYTIVAWDVTITSTNGQSSNERVMNEVLEISPNQSMKNISIMAVKGVNGIESSQTDASVLVRTIYTNTHGISSEEPFDGINIIRYIMEDGTSFTEKKLIRK